MTARSAARLFARLVVATALLAVAGGATAQSGSSSVYRHQRGMDETFRLNLGGLYPTFDTTVQYGTVTVPGTEIALEGDLGLAEKKFALQVDGYLRLGRHARLDFAYQQWNRSATKILSRQIQFNGATYSVGGEVDSTLNVNVAELYYGYSFVNNGDLEIGLGLGASVFFNRASLDAFGTVSGPGGTAGTAVSERKDFIAPIPALEGYFTFTLMPQLFLNARARGLKATISGSSGSMLQATGTLDLFITSGIGIGGGYNYTRIDYTRDSDTLTQVRYHYSGPVFYVALAF
ncbi:MAG: hypothetical protein NEA02_06185 [Thermoanaerobaculia bacterium]|nr:hypothetical protein [Thermoanaerobaculia bacterium]